MNNNLPEKIDIINYKNTYKAAKMYAKDANKKVGVIKQNQNYWYFMLKIN